MFSNVWRGLWVVVSLTLMLVLPGCGGASPASFSGNSVLPGVTISLSPQKVALQTNAQQAFTATVNNTSETTVAWLINGLPGGLQPDGSYPYGQIDSNGNYTAPPYVPIPPNVTVTAAATADNRVSANASVSISGAYAPGTVTISPTSAGLEAGGFQLFTATVNSQDKVVNWLVNNVQGGDLNVGTILQVPGSPDQAVYLAPSPFKGENPVTVTAVSFANPNQFALALVTISPIKGAVVTITSPAQSPTVPTGQTQAFQASVKDINDTTVSWQVDGIPGGNANVGRIKPGANDTATYTAPARLPNQTQAIQVIVSAVSNAQPTASASMLVSVIPAQLIKIVVSPPECTNPSAVPINSPPAQFTASVSGISNQAITWQVNGITDGDSTYGTITQDGLYTPPASVPSKNPVTITAVSQADPSAKGNLPITITTNNILAVTISPKSATVETEQGQPFTATVLGADPSNPSQAEVSWFVNGELNGGNGTYGTISGGSPAGCVTDANYLAPATVPNPDHFPVTAQSNYDSTKSAAATVTVTQAPSIIVSVSPDNVDVIQTQQQTFNAQITGLSDQNVYWSLSGQNCSGITCGSLSTLGPSTSTTYTAPAQAPLAVILTATAEADSSAQGTAKINVTCGGQPSISIYPTTVGVDAGTASPLSFSATITPCGNQSLPVTWQLGCISLSDGYPGEDCDDVEFKGGGPGCTQINNGAKVCGSRPNQGPGTDPLDYFAPKNLFTNAFAPNACELTNNGSGNGQVPLTASVTINGTVYPSNLACITVCPAGSPSCP